MGVWLLADSLLMDADDTDYPRTFAGMEGRADPALRAGVQVRYALVMATAGFAGQVLGLVLSAFV
jgi:hypothetical protein